MQKEIFAHSNSYKWYLKKKQPYKTNPPSYILTTVLLVFNICDKKNVWIYLKPNAVYLFPTCFI
ncbi:MAG: Uncharacterised protein [Flavobacteriaceae bacterium]|nr:MAG: Uncharacterised protein [Flavobacteriaceae bacterium]